MLRKLINKNQKLKSILLKIYQHTIEDYQKYRRKKTFQKHGKEALFRIDDAFREIGIVYWLEFGTLLGAVRDRGFIEHDNDIDLACFFDDFKQEHEKIFLKYGFKKTREFLIDNGSFGREETYTYKGVDVDIFYFHKRDHEMYCHLFMPQEGQGWRGTFRDKGDFLVRELTYANAGFNKMDFLGRNFSIPADIEQHLSASYGKNYMIKDKNYSNSIATNVRILKNKFGKGYLYA